MKILVIENKTPVGAALVKALRAAGHEVDWVCGIFHDLYHWLPRMAFYKVNEAELQAAEEIAHIDPGDYQIAFADESMTDAESGGLMGPARGWNIVEKLNRAGVVCIGITDGDQYCFMRFEEVGAVATCAKNKVLDQLPEVLAEAQRLVEDNTNCDELMGLTVRQPHAWAIFEAGKDHENRAWPTKIRGTIAIHAADSEPEGYYTRAAAFIRKILWKTKNRKMIPAAEAVPCNAIIGVVDIVDCVDLPETNADWFEGPLAFSFTNARMLKTPVPCPGKRRFFRLPAEVAAQVRAQLPIKR